MTCSCRPVSYDSKFILPFFFFFPLSVSTHMLHVFIYFYQFTWSANFLFPVLHCTHVTAVRWTYCFSQWGESTQYGRTREKKMNKIFLLWFFKHACLQKRCNFCFLFNYTQSEHTNSEILLYYWENGTRSVFKYGTGRLWTFPRRGLRYKWTLEGAGSAEGEMPKRCPINLSVVQFPNDYREKYSQFKFSS